jgi:hypothetical protein
MPPALRVEPHRSSEHVRGKPSRSTGFVQFLGMLIGERLDHERSVTCHVTRVKPDTNADPTWGTRGNALSLEACCVWAAAEMQQ